MKSPGVVVLQKYDCKRHIDFKNAVKSNECIVYIIKAFKHDEKWMHTIRNIVFTKKTD